MLNHTSDITLAVDCILFGYDGDSIRTLLIRRDQEPFAGQWTLPGGLVRTEESLDDCAKRILSEKTGLENIFLEQLYSFGTPDRDPRGRIVSVAYYALINPSNYNIVAGRAASEIAWFDWNEYPETGFDHAHILKVARQRLEAKAQYTAVGFELLEPEFTMGDLHHLHECLLNKSLNRRNFYKKITDMDILRPTGKKLTGVKFRSPELFEVKDRKKDL